MCVVCILKSDIMDRMIRAEEPPFAPTQHHVCPMLTEVCRFYTLDNETPQFTDGILSPVFCSFIVHMFIAVWSKPRWPLGAWHSSHLQERQRQVNTHTRMLTSLVKRVCLMVSSICLFLFSPRYNKLAKEWTQKYAMWRRWAQRKNDRLTFSFFLFPSVF